MKYKTEDGIALGQWANTQRKNKEFMSVERSERLEALPGWVLSVHNSNWEERFSHLKQYAEEHGNCLVEMKYKTEDGIALGQWANTQRKNKEFMSVERSERLEALPGWVWSV